MDNQEWTDNEKRTFAGLMGCELKWFEADTIGHYPESRSISETPAHWELFKYGKSEGWFSDPIEAFSNILRGLTPDQEFEVNNIIYLGIVPDVGFDEFDYLSKISFFGKEENKVKILQAVLAVVTPKER